MVYIEEIMNKNVISMSPNDNLLKAARIMSGSKISSVAVTDKGKFKGMIYYRDIIDEVAKNKRLENISAKEIISKRTPIFLSSDSTIMDCAKKMVEHKVSIMPIVDNQKIVGVVGDKEILTSAPELIEILSEKLKDRASYTPEEEIISGICDSCGQYSDTLKEVNNEWLCEECRSELL